VNVLQLSLTALLATTFTVIVAQAPGRVLPRVHETLRAAEARFVVALALLLGLAVVAVSTGVAAIVGAFLAGLVLAETSGPRERDLA
jgi:Kef-type K+ transport system membrane component KefB